MASVHFLNGAFVGEEGFVVPVRDLGYSRGYGVFDFMRTYNRRPFLLEKHSERLLNSAKEIGLPVPYTADEIADWVMQTLEKNPDGEKFIKVLLSTEGDGLRLREGTKPTVAIQVDDAAVYNPSMYEKGIGMIAVEHRRHLPLAKTTNYIEGVRQTAIAGKTGAFAPLYYSDVVHESCASNIFAVIDGELVTPVSHLLPGLTRGVLLKTLKLDIPVREKDFTLDAFRNAAEAFSTDSGKEVVPVTFLDGKPIGSGVPGPVTIEVMRQFRAYTMDGAW